MTDTAQVTMRQLAEVLNISPSTVSLVLNGRAEECRISKDTVDMVLSKAEELGYGLKRRPIHRKSLLLASPVQLARGGFNRGPLAEFLPALTDHLMGMGWVVRLAMDVSTNIFGVNDKMLEEVGVVVIPVRMDTVELGKTLARRAVKKGVIPVITGAIAPEVNCLSIDKDNYGGARAAAEHLYELGHRSVAVVTAGQGNSHGRDRLRGFTDVYAENGSPLPEEMIWHFDSWKLTTSHRKTLEFIKVRPMPTAIFYMGDSLALGGYYALREAGVSVPEDISIMGFDDSWGLEGEEPEMTTVRIDAESVSESVVTTLISMTEGVGPLSAQILCPGKMVVRRTTRAI